MLQRFTPPQFFYPFQDADLIPDAPAAITHTVQNEMGAAQKGQRLSITRADLFRVDNLMRQAVEDFNQKSFRLYIEKANRYIRNGLAYFGYSFESEEAFLNFAKERISVAVPTTDPHKHYVYLDYVNDQNKGRLVGFFSTDPNFMMEGNEMKLTIG